MTIDWKPIDLAALQGRIARGYAHRSPLQQRLWQGVRIEPEKWRQHPYGDQGGGFWVVCLIGCDRKLIANLTRDGFIRALTSSHLI
jgi:hypothetical protein